MRASWCDMANNFGVDMAKFWWSALQRFHFEGKEMADEYGVNEVNILCEERKFQQKCKEKDEENDNHITAIEDKIRLLQDKVFKGDHNAESSSYSTPTPRNTGKTHNGVDCRLIYRTLTRGSDGDNNRL
ncbi:hypothetical protein ACSQ67_003349 [Phaseolus vulgaris]